MSMGDIVAREFAGPCLGAELPAEGERPVRKPTRLRTAAAGRPSVGPWPTWRRLRSRSTRAPGSSSMGLRRARGACNRNGDHDDCLRPSVRRSVLRGREGGRDGGPEPLSGRRRRLVQALLGDRDAHDARIRRGAHRRPRQPAARPAPDRNHGALSVPRRDHVVVVGLGQVGLRLVRPPARAWGSRCGNRAEPGKQERAAGQGPEASRRDREREPASAFSGTSQSRLPVRSRRSPRTRSRTSRLPLPPGDSRKSSTSRCAPVMGTPRARPSRSSRSESFATSTGSPATHSPPRRCATPESGARSRDSLPPRGGRLHSPQTRPAPGASSPRCPTPALLRAVPSRVELPVDVHQSAGVGDEVRRVEDSPLASRLGERLVGELVVRRAADDPAAQPIRRSPGVDRTAHGARRDDVAVGLQAPRRVDPTRAKLLGDGGLVGSMSETMSSSPAR